MTEWLQNEGVRWKGKRCDRNLGFAVFAIAPFTASAKCHKAVKALENLSTALVGDSTTLYRVCQVVKSETSHAEEKLDRFTRLVEDINVLIMSSTKTSSCFTLEEMMGNRSGKVARSPGDVDFPRRAS